MRPILVAGKTGQLARCLVDVAEQRGLPIIAVGRPEFDLEDSGSIDRAVESCVAAGDRECRGVYGRR